MKFSITDFFSKCGQIRSFLRIWSHLLKKFSIGKLHFLCSVKSRIKSQVNWSEQYIKIHEMQIPKVGKPHQVAVL